MQRISYVLFFIFIVLSAAAASVAQAERCPPAMGAYEVTETLPPGPRTLTLDLSGLRPKLREWDRLRNTLRYHFDSPVLQPNFAGKYRLLWVGCGTECQIGIVVNLDTGQVTEAPTARWGYYASPWQRVLVVNPPPEKVMPVKAPHERPLAAAANTKVHYYEWTGTQFRRICSLPYLEVAQ